MALKGAPEFHRFTSTWTIVEAFFLSHYGFRARPINWELIGFMCCSLNQKNAVVPWANYRLAFLDPKYSNWDFCLKAADGNFLTYNFIPNSYVLSKAWERNRDSKKWRLNLHYLFRFSCKLTTSFWLLLLAKTDEFLRIDIRHWYFLWASKQDPFAF